MRRAQAQAQCSRGPHLPWPKHSWRLVGMLEALRRPDATSVPPSPFLRKGWRGCPTLQAQLGSSLVARGYRSWALAVSMTTAECSVLLGPSPFRGRGLGLVFSSGAPPPRVLEPSLTLVRLFQLSFVVFETVSHSEPRLVKLMAILLPQLPFLLPSIITTAFSVTPGE